MPAPVLPIQKLQYGVESVAGTLVPATRVVDHYAGTAKFRRDMENITVRNAGSFATAHRGYAGQETTEVDWEASATYDRLTDYGALFFDKVNTGTGSGATRTWTFTPSDTADNLARYSLEWGGTNFPSAYTLTGATGKSLAIGIKPNDPWRVKATLAGVRTQTGSLTSALSLPSTMQGDDVLWTQTSVYISGTGSAYGATQMTGRIFAADFTLTNGTQPLHTLDGVAYPASVLLTKNRELGVKIIAAYDSQDQYTATFASTTQRVQLKAVSGSKSVSLNINGYWESIPFGENNGVITTELNLLGLYDSTGIASDLQMVLVNGVTTLTSIP